MKIYIKNMVCQGTRKFVMMEIKRLGLKLISFNSGALEFYGELSPFETCALVSSLNKYGLKVSFRSEKSDSLYAFSNTGILYENDENFSEDGSMELTELTRVY